MVAQNLKKINMVVMLAILIYEKKIPKNQYKKKAVLGNDGQTVRVKTKTAPNRERDRQAPLPLLYAAVSLLLLAAPHHIVPLLIIPTNYQHE
jgi:hypothetical protein